MSDTILDDQLIETPNLRRRALLPTWIKVFIWIFFLFGAIAPIALVMGVLGSSFLISFYGYETNAPLSVLGLFLIAVFAFKGAVSYGLWTEKDWGVNAARIDGLLGIIICVIGMLTEIAQFSSASNFSLRLELIPLIFYYLKMTQISDEWSRRREQI